MRLSLIHLATSIVIVNAMTITSPEGGVFDPTQPITISWTSEPNDPIPFDLVIDQPGGLVSNQVIATGLDNWITSFIVSPNSVMTYGANFVIKAQSAAGQTLATSPSFSLSMGSAVTDNGQLSYVSTNTYLGSSAATSVGQSAIAATSSIEAPASAASSSLVSVSSALASATSSSIASASSAAASASEIVSSTSASVSATSVNSAAESSTTSSSSESNTITSSSGFSTSTTSRSSTTSASATSSESATTSQNAQPRLGSSSQITFTAAGVLAGLAALFA